MTISAETIRRADQIIADLAARRPYARDHAETFVSIERHQAYWAYLDGRTARARELNRLADRVARRIKP
jgi:hypothetical protein